MHVLLVSATTFEISETIAWLDVHTESLNALEAKLLISGVGQLQTAYALQNRIRISPPELVIQAGIGGFEEESALGKVFAIGSDHIADLGVRTASGFEDFFSMGFAEPDHFPFTRGKLMNPYRKLLEWTGLPVHPAITVNEIKSADLPAVQRNALPVVESMEGAALHYVCLMEKIPFLQIRAVSNVTGERDKARWKMNESRKNLHEVLVSLLKKLEYTDETYFGI